MMKRKDRSYRDAIFPGYPDLHVGPHAGNQVPKPGSGLRKKPMPPPGNHLESVEVIEKALAGALLVGKVLALGSLDAALQAVLV